MKYLVQPLVPQCAVAPGPTVNESRFYSMTATHSGKAMTVKDDNSIVQQTWAEEDRQRWKIEFLNSSFVSSGIDAVFNWESRGKAYFFKGNSYVRYNLEENRGDSGYPVPIAGSWPNMPWEFNEDIDAVLYWSSKYAYFFKGSEYVKYNLEEDQAVHDDPMPFNNSTWQGMPDNFCEGLDAALYKNSNYCYFFKGSQCVKYNMEGDYAEQGYPKSIKEEWPGMPDNFCEGIDGALRSGDGFAYFFKGDRYVGYDMSNNTVGNYYPANILDNWHGLPPFLCSPIWLYEVRIISVASGKVLGVPGGSNENSVAIVAQDWNNSDYQKWILEPLGHTGYKIISKGSGKLLDVYNDSDAEETKIVQFDSTGGNNQHWVFSDIKSANLFNERSILYEAGSYSNSHPSQEVGPGSYDLVNNDLVVGSDKISSVKVGPGMRVTLFADPNFQGEKKMFVKDTDWVGDDFNDKTSSVLVEKVVTLYKDANYEGTSTKLGIGRYRMADIDVGNNTLSSIKIPQGLMAIAYEKDNFSGNFKVFFEDTHSLGEHDFENKTSSIIIKALGVIVPKNALNFGDTISLQNGGWITAEPGGGLKMYTNDDSWQKFIVVRAGNTKDTRLVSYGDIIALKSQAHNERFVTVTSDGYANSSATEIISWEKFTIARIGDTQSKDFVAQGDYIVLKSVAHGTFLHNGPGTDVTATSNADTWTYWKVDSYTNNYGSSFGTSVTPSDTRGPCGEAACGEDTGWATLCAVNACGAAACGVAGALIAGCGAAAIGIGVCNADFAVAGACGAVACFANLGGIGVCGADACGIAACGAAGCGAAACGAAACGADACGKAASGIGGCGVNACGGDAGGIDACPADACGANACGINACPADACAADVCGIDVIPIIPFI